MALPNPAQSSAASVPMSNSIKEAIATGIKASLLTKQSSVLSKIPIFGQALSERAEEKKRALYESQGRDIVTGRKLTKEEIEERERRKASMDAMGEIREDVDLIRSILEKAFGKPTSVLDGLKKQAMPMIAPPSGGSSPYQLADEVGGNNLAAEEQKLEQQQADKETQLEVQEEDHTFFEKLFAKYFGKSDADTNKQQATAGGGLLSKIGGLFSGIAGAVDFLADAKTLGAGRMLGRGSRIGKAVSSARGLGGRILSGAGRMIGVGGAAAAAGGAAAATQATAPATQAAATTGQAAAATTQAATPAAGGAAAATQAATPAAKAAATTGQAAAATTQAATPAAGGFFSRAWGAVKGIGSKIGDTYGKVKGLVGGIGGLGKVVLGAIGPLIETVMSVTDIRGIRDNPALSASEKKEAIGKRIGQALGTILGGVGAMALLGPAGPLVTAALDAFGVGPGALGSYLAEKLGGEKLYDIASSIPGLGFMKVNEGVPTSEELAPEMGQEGMNVPEGMSPEDAMKNLGMNTPQLTPTEVATAIPTAIPSSAASLSSLQMESSALKAAPQVAQVVAPSNNAIVNNNNNVSWMSSLSPTRTGADIDEKVFRLGLAF